MPRHGITRSCPHCGSEFYTRPSVTQTYCSRSCEVQCRHERTTREQGTCHHCGSLFSWLPSSSKGLFCSKRCAYLARRTGHVDKNGYIWVWDGDRNIAEHRLIAERAIGRPLLRVDHVHHINEITGDNQDTNLQILTPSDHSKLHGGISGWSRSHVACVMCGTTERRHGGHGLCVRCRSREGRRRERGTQPHRYRV